MDCCFARSCRPDVTTIVLYVFLWHDINQWVFELINFYYHWFDRVNITKLWNNGPFKCFILIQTEKCFILINILLLIQHPNLHKRVEREIYQKKGKCIDYFIGCVQIFSTFRQISKLQINLTMRRLWAAKFNKN